MDIRVKNLSRDMPQGCSSANVCVLSSIVSPLASVDIVLPMTSSIIALT